MAVALRTASSFGRLASASGASARVWCGIEASRISQANASFFKDQESSFSKSKNTAGISQSTDLPARCQAAAVSVCPLPTRQAVEVLEQPIELEKRLPAPEALQTAETIEQHAAPLPRSFLAESGNGNLVECSARGSRPLYTNVLAEFRMRYTSQTEVIVEEDHSTVKSAFHAALAAAPDDARLVSEFAVFTWKALRDLDAAEELYNKAVALAPHDADIQQIVAEEVCMKTYDPPLTMSDNHGYDIMLCLGKARKYSCVQYPERSKLGTECNMNWRERQRQELTVFI